MQKLSDIPLFGRGFRPFFFMASFFGAAIVPLWIYRISTGSYPAGGFSNPAMWHGHEMIYGYTMAVIAGFLLTAVANWTGGAPVRGGRLAFLCGLWIAGRMAVNVDTPYLAAAILDTVFIPCLTIMLALPLYRSRNLRNFIFLLMLSILFSMNVWFYASQERMALYYALLVIAAMITVIGGRIIPSFTVAALRWKGSDIRITDQPVVDKIAIGGILVLAASWAIFGMDHRVSGIAALLMAAIHIVRMRTWHGLRSLSDPMLWILHAGYLWMVAGFALLGASAFVPFLSVSTAIHAFTAGAIGSLTIGMMVRVALGHTGRHMVASPGAVAAFLLMQVAALSRISAPFLAGDTYATAMHISAGSWAAAFISYLLSYSAILFGKRPDGNPA